jgi:Binding-protein-dependent transport system inner membrane component
LALVWELAVRLGWSDGRLVPPPSRIAATLLALAQTGELAHHALATVARVAAGFALGVFAGTLIGALTGVSSLARRLVDPTLQGLRAIPSIAWVPLFVLWLGIFEASKVALIAVGVFFPVYLGVLGAILSVDRKIVEVGLVFRLSGPALAWRILLPAALPVYVVSLRAGLGLGCCRDHGGLRGARVSVGRRPATGQAGTNHRRHSLLCGVGQIERYRARPGDGAAAALGRRVRHRKVRLRCLGSIRSARSIPMVSMRLRRYH